MTQTMRWFGPADPVRLIDIRQAGASEVVTALHHMPNGAVWPSDEIQRRKLEVEAAGLGWSVVESLPVHDGIKRRSSEWGDLVSHYCESLINLGQCGIRTVTYNFMPLLDWTRTDLAWELPDGARALRFEWEAVAAYDIHLLQRPKAADDYSPEIQRAAAQRFAGMSSRAKDELERTILAGLPGSEESFTSKQFLEALQSYANVGSIELRDNHIAFLKAVCPVADSAGIQLVVHPDDPPFPIFGLPRVVSTEADLAHLFAQVPSASNGLCFCTGSFGARSDNDLPMMIRRLGDRIGFLHLRSVEHESENSFHEAAHLEGDAGMAAVVEEVVRLSSTSKRSIPMRPDHGHQILDDINRGTNPGYSLLGRLRGLAELRGLERGLVHAHRAMSSDYCIKPAPVVSATI